MNVEPNNAPSEAPSEPAADEAAAAAAADETATAESAEVESAEVESAEVESADASATEDAADPEQAGAEPAGAEQAGAEQAEQLEEQSSGAADDGEDEDEDGDEEVSSTPGGPLELIEEEDEPEAPRNWYILKVQVNREDSIREALTRRVKMHGLEDFFDDIVVPTEDVVEFTKSGNKRTVKRKLYPGYIMVNMAINDDTWFLVRETPGIGDFTGSAGKPTPMDPREVERIIRKPKEEGEEDAGPRVDIPYESGDRVRVKDGHFLNFEGEVESIDASHGRVTVIINIFGRPTPVELEHWQIEAV